MAWAALPPLLPPSAPCDVPIAGVLFRYIARPGRPSPADAQVEYLRQYMPAGALVVALDQRNITPDRALSGMLVQMQRRSSFNGKIYVYKVLLPWTLTRMGICRALVVDADLVVRVRSLDGLLALPDSLGPGAVRPVLWLAAEQSSTGTVRHKFNVSFNGGVQLWDLEAMAGQRGAVRRGDAGGGQRDVAVRGDRRSGLLHGAHSLHPGFIGTVPCAWNWQVGSTDQDRGVGVRTRDLDALCFSGCRVLHLNWPPFKWLAHELRQADAAAACAMAGALFANQSHSRYAWPLRKVHGCLCGSSVGV